MSDTGGDLRGQHEQESISLRGRSTKRIGDEDGSSSADDFGLRRRFVSAHHEREVGHDDRTQSRPEPSTPRETAEVGFNDSAELKPGRKIQLGAESRRILDPENPDRRTPLMMKKKKKKRRSTRQPSVRNKLEKLTGSKSVHAVLHLFSGSFLVSGDDVRDPPDDRYVIYTLRDFIIYLIFMIITSLIIFGVAGSADNYIANVLGDLLVKSKFHGPIRESYELTFNEIKHRREMWAFIDQVVLELVYEKDKYSNDTAHMQEGYQVMLENMLFGVPQLRQVRVKGKTCEAAPLFEGIFDDCADYYSEAVEDTTTFGVMNGSAWKYQPATTDHAPVAGIFSTYGGGGFSINLERSLALSRNWIRNLERDGWIRFGTRAVILDFNLFNTNTQLFCAAKLVFEMAPISGVVPRAYFTTLKLVWYSGVWGFFIMSCQITFIGFIMFYSYMEILQIIRMKELYFSKWWNVLDMTIILVSYVTIILTITSIVSNRNFLIEQLDMLHGQEHVSFDRLVLLQSRYKVAEAVVAFLVWIKILKFSTLDRTLNLLLSSFAKVRSELMVATVFMVVLLVGFAILGMSVAGSLFKNLASIWPAMFTLFGLLGGGIHFYFDHKLYEVPFRTWLLLYIIVVIVIYLNIYVALIVHGYEIANAETDTLSDRAHVSDIVREVYCWFLQIIRKPGIVDRLRRREEEKQNIVVYTHLAEIVSRHNFDIREIGLIFNKHGVRFAKFISIETMVQIYNEINVRNQLFIETEGHNQINEQLDKISRNVEQVDQTVMSVMTKVDTLTNKYLTDKVKK